MIVINVWTWNIEDYFIILILDTHIYAHLTRVTAHAWDGELDTGRYVPAGGIVCVLECETAAQTHGSR